MHYRACVISHDPEFAQFVRLTLSTRVRPVTISSSEEIPDADIYVVDLDTVPAPPALTGKVLWCSALADKPQGCPVLWADRPFRPARLLALLDLAEDDAIPHIHPYPDRSAVLVGEEEIPLSSREHALLLALFARVGEYISREELLSLVWGDEEADPGVVNVYIHYLRRKLETNGQRCIFAARGRGYMLKGGTSC